MAEQPEPVLPVRERLKQLRNERGWSQADLAAKVGGDAGQISRYENGHMTPSADAIVRLAEALDVSCDYLLVQNAPRRRLRPPDHPLGDRLADLDELNDDDLTALVHIIDALIAKNRVTAAITPRAS